MRTPTTTTTTSSAPTTAQRVMTDFRAYLLCHVNEIAPSATPRERRRIREIITRTVR